jgi:hypothetical protein
VALLSGRTDFGGGQNAESNSIGKPAPSTWSGNARQWIVSGLGKALDARDRDSEFAQRETIPRADLLSRLRQTIIEVDGHARQIRYGQTGGKENDSGPRGDALEAILHVVEHFFHAYGTDYPVDQATDLV